MWISSFNPHNNPERAGTIAVSKFPRKKGKIGEAFYTWLLQALLGVLQGEWGREVSYHLGQVPELAPSVGIISQVAKDCCLEPNSSPHPPN